jgi:hypothetical protein
VAIQCARNRGKANTQTAQPRSLLPISFRFVIHPEQGAWERAMGLHAVSSFR